MAAATHFATMQLCRNYRGESKIQTQSEAELFQHQLQ